MPSIFVKTLGCKVNAFDSHVLAYQFQQRGFVVDTQAERASVIVINSCSVTANADKEALYYARRFRRQNGQALLVITGCYAQTNSSYLSSYPEIDFVVPNDHKPQLVELVCQRLMIDGPKLPTTAVAVSDNRQTHFKLAQTLSDHIDNSAVRKYVKVQDGCNGFCSYCIIPYARGASISVPIQQIISQVERLTRDNVCEIILTGVHLGDYGDDIDDNTSFVTLLERLFALKTLNRLRISSLEPSELSSELLSVLHANGDKFCPHFHLPLQSADDRILRLMRRKYTVAEYHQRLQEAQRLFPQAMFGSDLICGFPSETSDEHRATLDFCKRAGLHYLHAFPYSPRPNTAALRIKGHLATVEIKRRVAETNSLSIELKRAFAEKFIDRKLSVLWEQRDKSDQRWMIGHSRNYLRVLTTYDTDLLHRETTVVAHAVDDRGQVKGMAVARPDLGQEKHLA